MLRQRSYLKEDEEQRRLRAQNVDPDRRLPNVHVLIPASRMSNVPYRGQDKVAVYRGVDRGDKTPISPGDWVALDRRYAKKLPGGKILKKTVLARDVVWAGTDETEWFYAPMKGS